MTFDRKKEKRQSKIININDKIILDFFGNAVYVLFHCRRCSSVVEHVIGNDGVASPILASGTIFRNAPFEVLFCYKNQASQPVRFYEFWKYQFGKNHRTFIQVLLSFVFYKLCSNKKTISEVKQKSLNIKMAKIIFSRYNK